MQLASDPPNLVLLQLGGVFSHEKLAESDLYGWSYKLHAAVLGRPEKVKSGARVGFMGFESIEDALYAQVWLNNRVRSVVDVGDVSLKVAFALDCGSWFDKGETLYTLGKANVVWVPQNPAPRPLASISIAMHPILQVLSPQVNGSGLSQPATQAADAHKDISGDGIIARKDDSDNIVNGKRARSEEGPAPDEDEPQQKRSAGAAQQEPTSSVRSGTAQGQDADSSASPPNGPTVQQHPSVPPLPYDPNVPRKASLRHTKGKPTEVEIHSAVGVPNLSLPAVKNNAIVLNNVPPHGLPLDPAMPLDALLDAISRLLDVPARELESIHVYRSNGWQGIPTILVEIFFFPGFKPYCDNSRIKGWRAALWWSIGFALPHFPPHNS